MHKATIAVLFTILAPFAVIKMAAAQQPLVAASRERPDLPPEQQMMLAASEKTLEALQANLDGDRPKLEKAAGEAVVLYDQIVAANPANIKALNGRAAVKEMLGEGSGSQDYKNVVDITTAAVGANEMDAEAYYNRAVAYRGLKMFPEARADYQKAINLDPRKPHWLTELQSMEAMVR